MAQHGVTQQLQENPFFKVCAVSRLDTGWMRRPVVSLLVLTSSGLLIHAAFFGLPHLFTRTTGLQAQHHNVPCEVWGQPRAGRVPAQGRPRPFQPRAVQHEACRLANDLYREVPRFCQLHHAPARFWGEWTDCVHVV